MKKRLPAEEKSVNALFDITLNGHMRPGDSVGVWTFNRDLHTGVFPLVRWNDDALASFPSELNAFLKKQRYTKDTHFDALMPTLDEVVRTSLRLTIFIFCDGDGQVVDNPYADSINSTFKQHQRLMEKGHFPFVIVLRSQIGEDGVGHYVGCTISSAASISLPQFPPLPLPPPSPTPAKRVAPPPPVVPSLIIIGTNNPATNQPPPPAPPQQQPQPQALPEPPAPRPNVPAAPVPPASSPAPSVPISDTNSIPPLASSIQPTNAAVVPPPAPSPTVLPAAAQAVPPETAATGKGGLIAAGAGLFIVAIAILVFILRRARRRDSASLITESLKKDKIHS